MKVSVRTVVQPQATSDAEANGQDSKQVMHLSHPGDCCCTCMTHVVAVTLALLTRQLASPMSWWATKMSMLIKCRSVLTEDSSCSRQLHIAASMSACVQSHCAVNSGSNAVVPRY